jgi:hypothetical protein
MLNQQIVNCIIYSAPDTFFLSKKLWLPREKLRDSLSSSNIPVRPLFSHHFGGQSLFAHLGEDSVRVERFLLDSEDYMHTYMHTANTVDDTKHDTSMVGNKKQFLFELDKQVYRRSES